MLRLNKVSKFYYNKGVIATGFTKISVDLDIGEMVAITGESGSGKSTLLNVISGLDSYEEGEMYINGLETSHYNENDFEEYRKKYICNIFQSFNLVNSYTVYQNIELIMILNGMKAKDVKTQIIEIIKRVDLYKYRNTKVSKLSGGQKQRVAIARALAKDSPIIIADEPTGNLDATSAKGIVKLLSEIANDKLVIIVTHNYDQIEKYVTRKIRMHDGKIIEDIKIKETKNDKNIVISDYGNIKSFSKLRLGLRNTFNILPKFLLLFAVFLFIIISLLSIYSSFKKQEYENSLVGYNYLFKNTSDKRIVINKLNRSEITEDDFNKINSLSNIENVFKDDILLDASYSITPSDKSSDIFVYGTLSDASLYEFDKVDRGKMPKNEDEAIIYGYEFDYYLSEQYDSILDHYFDIKNSNDVSLGDFKIKIVGIKYLKDTSFLYSSDSIIYVNSKVLDYARKTVNSDYSTMSIEFANKIYNKYDNYQLSQVFPSYKVPYGKVVISNENNYQCNDFNCVNYDILISVNNLYYKDQLSLKVSNTYNKDNLNNLTGYSDFDQYAGSIFVNSDQYFSLYNKGHYQSSIFVSNPKIVKSTIKELNDLGYQTLYIKDTLVSPDSIGMAFLRIFKIIVLVIVAVALFFISYGIIKIIFKSKNIYYATIRILGASKKTIKSLISLELFNTLNIVYLLFIGLMFLISGGVIKNNYLNDLVSYLKITDYIIVYLIIVIMTYFMNSRYSRFLFKHSAMKTYRDEV